MLKILICLLYLIIVSFCDVRIGKIPNFLTFGFFIAILVYDIFTVPSKIPEHLLSAFFFFILFFVTWRITKGLGMGDVKLASVLGYCSGFFMTTLVFVFASFTGIIFFLAVNIFRKKIRKVPFAPFVTAGYMMSELICRRIL
nr:A24 family peptidase [uncultured Treponema sp.]